MISRRLRTAVWSMLVTLLVAAVPVATLADTALHIGNGTPPGTLEPSRAATGSELLILGQIYEGLTTLGPAGDVTAGAAERWEVSDDGLVWTFHLRDNARWSNGEAVVADDFVSAFHRAVAPETETAFPEIFLPIRNAAAIYTQAGEPVTTADELGIAAIDPRTLAISLEKPVAALPAMLAHVAAAPAREDEAGNVLYNGPFMIAGEDTGTLTLTPNPHFRNFADIGFERLVLHATENPAAAARRFNAGELHISRNAPPGSSTVHASPSMTAYRAVLDHRTPPMNDARIRRALALAIDRTALANVAGTMTVPQHSIVPTGLPGYESPLPDFTSATKPDRQDAARQLLADAGYNESLSPLLLRIRHANTPSASRVAGQMAEAWRAIGAQVTLIPRGTETLYSEFVRGDAFSIALTTYTGLYADPGAFLDAFGETSLPSNYARWQSDVYDALLLEAASEKDAGIRLGLLRQAETLLLSENIVIPLISPANAWLVSTRISGWHDNPADAHPARHLLLRP